MVTDASRAGHGGPDLEGCAKNHCHAKRLQSDKACHQAAGRGTDHPGMGRCANHGGATPTHRKAAQAEQARAAVVTFGLPVEIDPGQALLEEVHRTAGHVAWLASVVAALEQDDVVWGVVEEIEHPDTFDPRGNQLGGGTEVKRKAAPNAWVVLYQAERQHLARVAKAAIDAGVNERVVQVYEQIAASYVQVLEQVLDDLELSPGQRARVPQVVQGRLRAIAGGGVGS